MPTERSNRKLSGREVREDCNLHSDVTSLLIGDISTCPRSQSYMPNLLDYTALFVVPIIGLTCATETVECAIFKKHPWLSSNIGQ